MQDLIRIRVADSAEQMRIGERALERMTLACQQRSKCLQIGFQYFGAARIERTNAFLSAHQMQRRPPLRPRFGQEQCSI